MSELLTTRWAPLRPHPIQRAYWNSPARFNVVSAGRRSGKTELAKRKLVIRSVRGTKFDNARFFAAAPTRDQAKKIYWSDLKRLVPAALVDRVYEGDLVIRLKTETEIHVLGMDVPARIEGQPWDGGVLDEYGNMKEGAWGENVRPALADRLGWCDLIGVPEGMNHYHEKWEEAERSYAELGEASEWRCFTWKSSSVLPPEEVEAARRDLHPQVFLQEYEGAWVNWAGTAFFPETALLEDGKPAAVPKLLDVVFATIDCAVKDGREHDGTAVIYWGLIAYDGKPRLVILDWDVIQVDAALLVTWLPSVNARLDELCRQNRVRKGSAGAFIEDAASGAVLLQQARRSGIQATAIDSKLTAMGKDARAFSVSGYVHRGAVRVSPLAYDKVVDLKGKRKNHLLSQVSGFRVGDPDAAKRADDLFDCFCYGIICGLGDNKGW